MTGADLAAQVRGLLAIRDSARRRQLFRPDRAIEADARFVAAVVAAAGTTGREGVLTGSGRLEMQIQRLEADLALTRDKLAGAEELLEPQRAEIARLAGELEAAQRLADGLRAELAEAKPATVVPRRPRSAPAPRRASPATRAKPGTAQGRRNAPGGAE